ncbi:putative 3-hydroxybutyryl-CoA dehydrogenase [uncultured delta proteobacterium]|uniref:Putative 3-hydroxybutyryl-CoA dehydrogenase n=1 Tax=uncultured delta proteobacterium TaxID=34034 RepID=A0A212KA37_9DELT|nr:putative 3-hydroxybutyryl-CoA dehydrogenase [uncultured delta proteobacterium]
MKRIGVIGCGFMGSGIAQVCAQAGYDVLCYDASRESMDKSRAGIEKSFDSRIKKGKATEEDKRKTLDNIRYAADLAAFADRDIVIEAVYEDLDVKVGMFKEVGAYVSADCIFVSNTSGLCISDMAERSGRPDKLMGAHFFSPVPVMKLVELIRGNKTSDATYQAVRTVTEDLRKVIVDAPDGPGFIVNLLLVVIMNEASRMLELGADPTELDAVLKAGLGMPMGGLGLADLSGLDVCIKSTANIYEGLGVRDFAVPRMLRRLYDYGHLGLKTGRGYFTYPAKA